MKMASRRGRSSMSTSARKQGMALADFTGMVAKPATKPGETKSLITELERRMKTVYEVTVELISDNHAKSVLVGMLDPMTRQHTAMHHGGNTGYEKLKRVVLEFTNNVAGSDSAIQVDQIAETLMRSRSKNTQGQTQRHGRDQERSVRELVSATTARDMATLRASVPSKGKGKGFEKGTDEVKGKGMSTYGPIRNNAKGKGKSKGPMFGTCWTCGGAHYAATRARASTKWGEPEVFDQREPEEWESPEIRTLSHIRSGCSTRSRRARARRAGR